MNVTYHLKVIHFSCPLSSYQADITGIATVSFQICFNHTAKNSTHHKNGWKIQNRYGPPWRIRVEWKEFILRLVWCKFKWKRLAFIKHWRRLASYKLHNNTHRLHEVYYQVQVQRKFSLKLFRFSLFRKKRSCCRW